MKAGIRSYVVGGAVRDRLLGLPVSDRDHVVVGATVDDMLAQGFKPVGRDFPVFLHPETHEEYALARTERKVAPGYAGFVFHAAPDVTLAQDLERRDFTVNAIAEDEATGELIDPHGGRADLAARVFRHVGPAFVEDPVRILRLARFAARFTDFTIAGETSALARRMVDEGEVDALVPERVWQEIARGLMEARPSRMVDVLRRCGAEARLLAEAKGASTVALDRTAAGEAALPVRFAAWLLSCDVRSIDSLSDRLIVPRAVRDVAVIASREREALLIDDPIETVSARAERLVGVLERSDAMRRAPRFMQAVEAIAASVDDFGPRRLDLDRVMEATRRVDAATIAREATSVPIPARLHAARVTNATLALNGDR